MLPLIHTWSGLFPSTVTPKKPPSYHEIMESFINQTASPNFTKATWKGQCLYPWYIPPAMQQQSWFQPFLRHLQQVDLSKAASRYIQMRDCARWWSASPQISFNDTPPRSRLVGWKPKPLPPLGYKRPKCKNFGQKLVPRGRCSSVHEVLWRALDKLGILYFPRSGTELGILRGGQYLTSDGDLDIFVDMPQKMLIKTLKKVLKLQVYLREYDQPYWFCSYVVWKAEGGPEVHMVFNNWMEDELSHGNFSQRSGYLETCECFMNSVPMSCHKEAAYRTWLMYGPAWRVPLQAKAMDVPHRAHEYNVVGVLSGLVSKDGVIHEEAIRALDKNIIYSPLEMQMILAQVNELHALISCQKRRQCIKG